MDFKDTLTEEQSIVYNIIKSYLKKNPNFTIYELFLHIKRNCELQENQIFSIIDKFISKKIIVEGSKLTKESVLSRNDTRNSIYNYIIKKPGLNFSQIIKHFNLGPHAGRWHIEMLKKFGFIRETKFMIYNLYYDRDFPEEKEIITFLLRNENVFNVFLVLMDNILKASEISKLIDKPQSTVQYHLTRMVDNHVIIENYDGTFSVNSENINFLRRYFNLELPKKLKSKIESYIKSKEKPLEPLVEEKKGTVKVLREYDYLGGNIRFKIAIQNHTPITISNVNTMLTATSQYDVDERIKSVDFLVPGESRGVDFILSPSTCGKSKVYATVSYSDGHGDPQSIVVKPKEIWVKCPLVKPRKILSDEIEKWKEDLQKGTHIIECEDLQAKKLFEVAYNQVKTLDLEQTILDKNNLRCVFSGIAKVTNTRMMVEIHIFLEKRIIINIWADNLKQATGFLAYLKNLINLGLDSAQKLSGKVETLGKKILKLFEISDRLYKLFELCEENWIISEIIIMLKEIKKKLNIFFPDLEIIDSISNIIELFVDNVNVGEEIDDNSSLRIQIDLNSWLDNIIYLLKSNIDVFNDTFKEEKEQCDLINSMFKKLDQYSESIKSKLIQKLLSYLIIMDKDSGLTIYSHNFKESSVDGDLLSGFLTAIQQFGSELSEEKTSTSVKKIEYHGFEINLEDGNKIRTALILKGKGADLIKERLIEFVSDYEKRYNDELSKWSGNISVFSDSPNMINEYFGKEESTGEDDGLEKKKSQPLII